MYLLTIEKFGIKNYYTCKTGTRLLKQLKKSFIEYELDYNIDDFPSLRTLQTFLKNLDTHDFKTFECAKYKTKARITKTEFI